MTAPQTELQPWQRLLAVLDLDKPTARQRSRWYQLLHRQVRSGLDLRQALPMLPDAAGMGRWQAEVLACVAAMDSGKPLDQALALAPSVWTPLDRAQLVAAQEAGKLEPAVLRLGAVWQDEAEWDKERKQALSYPLFLMVSACLLDPAVLLVTASFGAWFAEALRNIAVLVVVLLLLRWGLSRLRQLILQWQVPLLAAFLQADQKARVLAVLADATEAGVPATTALPLARAAADSVAQPLHPPALLPILRDKGWGAAVHALVPLRGDETAALHMAQTTGALPQTLHELAKDARETARSRERLLLKLLRGGVMAIAIGLALLQMTNAMKVVTDPLSALSGPEGDMLRQELERAAPELLQELPPR